MEKKTEPWHLSRTINISHLLTTAVLVIGMISYVSGIEKNVALHGQQIAHNSVSQSKMVKVKCTKSPNRLTPS